MYWNKFIIDGQEVYSTKSKWTHKLFGYDDCELLQNEDTNFLESNASIPMMQSIKDYELEFLPEGVYKCQPLGGGGVGLFCTELVTKETILDFSVIEKVCIDFSKFLSHKKLYAELGLAYKRGCLLYGPPGTGKTTAIHKIISLLRPENSVVIFINTNFPIAFMKAFKHDDRLKIFIFEEMTECIKSLNMNVLLDFLDGESSLTNCFMLASTNYPQELPQNIVGRPGRFDILYNIGYLSTIDISKYYKRFFNRDIEVEELDLFVDVTIAELKEIFLLSKRDGLTLRQAYNRLKEQMELAKRDFSKKEIGFVKRGWNEDD